MARTPRALLVTAALSACGCRAIGNLPGIDPTDYAYLRYKCETTQVYAQPVPRLKNSVLEALADMGFEDIRPDPDAKPPCEVILARTLDGRKTRITLKPRNQMSSMTVFIAPIGDEMVAQALIQRVALNFGELPRTLVPIEGTLRRRLDPLSKPISAYVPAPGAVVPGTAVPPPGSGMGPGPIPPEVPVGPGPFVPAIPAEPIEVVPPAPAEPPVSPPAAPVVDAPVPE